MVAAPSGSVVDAGPVAGGIVLAIAVFAGVGILRIWLRVTQPMASRQTAF